MSTSINQVILCGRLGKDPDIRTLDNGTKVGDFSLATGGDKFTTKDGREVEIPTQWHNVVCWRGNAEFAEKALKKGMAVTVFGEINYRKYQDRDGQDRYTTDIIVHDLFLGGEAKGGNPARPEDKSAYAQPSPKPAEHQTAPQVQAPAPQTQMPEPPINDAPPVGAGDLPF